MASRLSVADVVWMREMYHSGKISIEKLQELYGRAYSSLYRCLHGQAYASYPGPTGKDKNVVSKAKHSKFGKPIPETKSPKPVPRGYMPREHAQMLMSGSDEQTLMMLVFQAESKGHGADKIRSILSGLRRDLTPRTEYVMRGEARERASRQ